MSRKVDVREHERKTPSGGRTDVSRHERNIRDAIQDDDLKENKDTANYREPYVELGNRYDCRDCYYYNKGKSCKIVEGKISPDAGCDRWVGDLKAIRRATDKEKKASDAKKYGS